MVMPKRSATAAATRWAWASTFAREKSGGPSGRPVRWARPLLPHIDVAELTPPIVLVAPSELQCAESPVQHRAVRFTRFADGVDQRPQPQHPPVVGRLGRLDVQLAVQGVTLVNGPGVIARLPAQHRHQIGQQPARLREGQPDGMPTVHQPAPAAPRIMMCGSNIQGEPGQLGVRC